MIQDIVPPIEREKYADLILHLLAVDKDDVVLINTQFGYEQMIYTLVQKAYQKGAKYVAVSIKDQYLQLLRAQYSHTEYLEYLPNNIKDTLSEYSDMKACVVSLRSPLEKDIGNAVSAEALSVLHRTYQNTVKHFHEGVISDRFTWIVTAYPTLVWGKNIFPHLDPTSAGKKLWEHMRNILMLDKDDCITAWEEKISRIQKRKQYLDNKKYHALHFVGEGTNWFVSLNKRSVWSGAVHTSSNGKRFQANVPTEETYTSPDCRYSHGTVTVQRPIEIFGKTIDGITMTFSQGKVVSASAQSGNDALQSFLRADERNQYLGEIALVDTHSLVWESGIVFNNILFDENAGVHFALGTAYTTGYGFGHNDKKEKEELLSIGCNVSCSHEDFTIGHEKLSVYGVYYNEDEESDIANKTIKNEEAIISQGLFVID